MKKLFKLFILLIFLPSTSFSIMVATERDSVKSNHADMNLSGLIVRKVIWEDGAVIMPVTVASERIYQDVKLVSRELYLKMENCFINGCPEYSESLVPPMPRVKFESLKKLNSKVRVSNIDVSFDDSIIVTIGVMASNYQEGSFWLSYPQSIDFSNPALKQETERVVFDAWIAENPHLTVKNSSDEYKQEPEQNNIAPEQNTADAVSAPVKNKKQFIKEKAKSEEVSGYTENIKPAVTAKDKKKAKKASVKRQKKNYKQSPAVQTQIPQKQTVQYNIPDQMYEDLEE